MTGKTLLLVVQLLFAAALMWTCFCRIVKTDRETYREVRWAIVLEGAAAGVLLGAPVLPLLMPGQMRWAPWTTPAWAWVLLLISVTILQVVTARYWTGGKSPKAFRVDDFDLREHGPFPPTGGGPAFALAAVVLALGMLLPQPAHAQEMVWRKDDGSVQVRLRITPCENFVLGSALAAAGILGQPKAAVVTTRHGDKRGCWALDSDDMSRIVLADESGAAGVMPVAHFRSPPL